MQIQREGERGGTIGQPTVVIAANIRRERETLDKHGNVIDPRTRQIIRPKEIEPTQ